MKLINARAARRDAESQHSASSSSSSSCNSSRRESVNTREAFFSLAQKNNIIMQSCARPPTPPPHPSPRLMAPTYVHRLSHQALLNTRPGGFSWEHFPAPHSVLHHPVLKLYHCSAPWRLYFTKKKKKKVLLYTRTSISRTKPIERQAVLTVSVLYFLYLINGYIIIIIIFMLISQKALPESCDWRISRLFLALL